MGIWFSLQNNSWGTTVSHDRFLNFYNNSHYNRDHVRLYNDIYNSTTSVTEWIRNLDRFQEKGVIVWANPNNNGDDGGVSGKGPGIENMFPQYFPELKEAFINVANVDLVGTKGSGSETYRLTSEKCGASAEWCVSGDGTWLKTLDHRDDGRLNTGTGTSYMAPQVTAAIALIAQAFPNQTPAQWTARVLASANKNITKDNNLSPYSNNGLD